MFCLPKALLFITRSDLQFENKLCCGELQTEQGEDCSQSHQPKSSDSAPGQELVVAATDPWSH